MSAQDNISYDSFCLHMLICIFTNLFWWKSDFCSKKWNRKLCCGISNFLSKICRLQSTQKAYLFSLSLTQFQKKWTTWAYYLRTLTLPNNSGSFSVCSLVENVNRLSEQIDSTNRHQNNYSISWELPSEKIFFSLLKLYCFFEKQFCFSWKKFKKVVPYLPFSRLSRLLCCCLLLSSRVFPIQTTKNLRK